MARNYLKFYLVSGYYDDGSGGQIAFNNFFANEFQAEAFPPLPWVSGNPQFAGKIYVPMTKLLIQQWLNKYASLAQVPIASTLVPPFVFYSSPRQLLDETDPDDV